MAEHPQLYYQGQTLDAPGTDLLLFRLLCSMWQGYTTLLYDLICG
jgi:hypothetical protein